VVRAACFTLTVLFFMRLDISSEFESVFRYAMEENGAWQGIHCEGALMFSIFALLMFDVIWSLTGPLWTISSIYIDSPLDLG